MPNLTPKQEKFCVEYVKCGNQSEAYRLAYDAKNMKPETIHKRASELLANGEVAGRVADLQAPAAKKAQITLESHLDELETLREMAKQANQLGSAIAAETNRGKAVGIYIERSQVEVKVDMGQVESKLARLLGKLAGDGV